MWLTMSLRCLVLSYEHVNTQSILLLHHNISIHAIKHHIINTCFLTLSWMCKKCVYVFYLFWWTLFNCCLCTAHADGDMLMSPMWETSSHSPSQQVIPAKRPHRKSICFTLECPHLQTEVLPATRGRSVSRPVDATPACHCAFLPVVVGLCVSCTQRQMCLCLSRRQWEAAQFLNCVWSCQDLANC